MGKRKKSSRQPQGKKKREPLATQFKCVFCAHETSVGVSIDRKNKLGTLHCRQCGQHFQSKSPMDALMQPVDIYFEWIDACEDVAKEQAAAAQPPPPSARATQPSQREKSRLGMAPGERMTEEDRQFIEDDEADAEQEYADDVHMSSTAKLHGIKRQLKRQGTSSDLGSSPPPKRLRKKDRELLLHSEMMNDFSDNENENGATTDGDDVMSAFTRR
ncbi:hypothetical protein D0862_05845 [Hortaea werneckii]|uniref:Transcription elongation factor 1 homolog n=1 Tax=Hortaea werneckii TaxID=91943 RepID=A0A3M7GP38_HORWE|nr:hypothetical protein D0862_05845 [Hortaea werneckii]